MYVYFGHHKCATTWITGILHYVCHDAGISIRATGRPKASSREANGHPLDTDVDFLVIRNATVADFDLLLARKPFRGFHVIRDPRDVLVSAYYSHLQTHPTRMWPDLVEQRNKLSRLTEEEGLLATAEFIRPVFEDMKAWPYSDDRVLELRFEEMTSAPFESFLAVFRFLGLLKEERQHKSRRFVEVVAGLVNATAARTNLPFLRWRLKAIPAELILGQVHANGFSKLANGRAIGQIDVHSHFRRGIAGDWRNHFTPKVKRVFKEEWQGLLEKLGYEQNANW